MRNFDELLSQCRNSQTKEHFKEALNCCKGGAYRATITQLWTTLIYDYVYKLEELVGNNDDTAKEEYEKLKKIIEKNDIHGSLTFEQQVLKNAYNKYMFINATEYEMLERLHTDRNLCAHPSLGEELLPYNFSADVARVHIENLFNMMLTRPPIRGKVMIDRIIKLIESESIFPKNFEKAKCLFQNELFKDVKDTVKRNVFILILKRLLLEESNPTFIGHFKVAFECIKSLETYMVENILSEKLDGLIMNVPESRYSIMMATLSLLNNIDQYINQATIVKLETFLDSTDDILYLIGAYRISVLSTKVLDKIKLYDDQVFRNFISCNKDVQIADIAVTRFCSASSFLDAEQKFEYLVIPLITYLKEEHFNNILMANNTNKQIRESWGMKNLYKKAYDILPSDAPGKKLFESLYLA